MNEPVSLNRLLAPFGLGHGGEEDSTLFIGMVCDHLLNSYKNDEAIDPIDVGMACLDLGYEPASQFLEEASFLLCRMLEENLSF